MIVRNRAEQNGVIGTAAPEYNRHQMFATTVMESIAAIASTLAVGLAVGMLIVGVSALVVRVSNPSISRSAVIIFWWITEALLALYLFFSGQFFWFLMIVATGFYVHKNRSADYANRDALVVQGVVLVLLGTVGVLDKLGIDYLRAPILIPAAFLILVAFVWVGIVESKKEYPAGRTEHTASEN